jgi:hypothetical protein
MNITVSITDNASPTVLELQRDLRSRRALHQKIGAGVRERIRDYTIGESAQRHTTSKELGAPASGFVGKAARAIESATPLADDEGVTVFLPHPYFARAFGDVDIFPTTGLYLTIPKTAQAYNQQARQVSGLFFGRSKKTGKAFLGESIRAPGVKARLVVWYSLVTSVHQTQDRSRLPSDEAIIAAAKRAIELFFQERLLRLKQSRAARN